MCSLYVQSALFDSQLTPRWPLPKPQSLCGRRSQQQLQDFQFRSTRAWQIRRRFPTRHAESSGQRGSSRIRSRCNARRWDKRWLGCIWVYSSETIQLRRIRDTPRPTVKCHQFTLEPAIMAAKDLFRELETVVRESQGHSKASWKPENRPEWWIPFRKVPVGDGWWASPGPFRSRREMSWSTYEAKAPLFMCREWRMGNWLSFTATVENIWKGPYPLTGSTAECCFCPTNIVGPKLTTDTLMGSFADKRGVRCLYVHFECGSWAPEVVINLRTGAVLSLYGSYPRRHNVCSYCSQGGATIHCSADGCARVLHYECISAEGGLSLEQCFVPFCNDHAPFEKKFAPSGIGEYDNSSTSSPHSFKNDERVAGLVFENCSFSYQYEIKCFGYKSILGNDKNLCAVDGNYGLFRSGSGVDLKIYGPTEISRSAFDFGCSLRSVSCPKCQLDLGNVYVANAANFEHLKRKCKLEPSRVTYAMMGATTASKNLSLVNRGHHNWLAGSVSMPRTRHTRWISRGVRVTLLA
ncbi:PHD-like zinc-binding protein [Gracilaria domingensis]|nr:PHD-like zinc-binding protein [Gracilaria domingensis]